MRCLQLAEVSMHRDRDKPGRESPFVNMRICDELSASSFGADVL